MSTQYSDQELRDIKNPDEIPNELYVRWVRLKFQRPKRKRRQVVNDWGGPRYIEVWNSNQHSSLYQWF